MATWPSEEAVLTMAPPPLFIIASTWYLMHQNTLVRSTRSARSHCAVVNSCKGSAHCSRPALLNAPSSRPYAATARSTSALTSCSALKSALTKMPAPAPALISSTVAAPDSSATSLTTTLAPALASTTEAARPMPPPAPVTMMVLPCSAPVIGISLFTFCGGYGTPVTTLRGGPAEGQITSRHAEHVLTE